MLQRDSPVDYVIATGKVHSVRELVELAFSEIDMEITWVDHTHTHTHTHTHFMHANVDIIVCAPRLKSISFKKIPTLKLILTSTYPCAYTTSHTPSHTTHTHLTLTLTTGGRVTMRMSVG